MHILVVDDEKLARQRLIRLLDNMGDYDVVGEAENGEKAIEAVQIYDPDLVLMDVKMPGIDGMSAAKTIAELEDPPAIIFCTAYDDYALEAFDAQAVGYLVKPVNQDQLKLALDKAQRVNKVQRAVIADTGATQSQRKHISAKSRKGIALIPIDEVFCFLADQKYVTVLHAEGETLVDDTLKVLENELGGSFVRVHRNALVAVKEIVGLQRNASGTYEIQLRRSEYRPMVSRRHLSQVKSLVSDL